MCSKKSRKIQGIGPVLESLFNIEIKIGRYFPVWKISKITFLTEHLWTTA